MDVRVRKTGAEDLDLVESLWRAMVVHHRSVVGGRLPMREPAEAWERRRKVYANWLADSDGFLLLAEPGAGPEAGSIGGGEVLTAPGGPLGYAFCRVVPSEASFDFGIGRGEIESLSVAPAARGRGVGTALLHAAKDAFRDRGCTYWGLAAIEQNAAAIALYERIGFRTWVREMIAPID